MYSRALKLCLVTNLKNQTFSQYKSFLEKAIEGGITSIQLREKTSHPHEFQELAFQFKKFLKPYAIPLILNDHVEIAKEIDADGVHIGQSDLAPDLARQILGKDKMIGLSVESLEEVERANQLTSIDYIAASAVFKSRTKPDCKTIWGIEGLDAVVQLSKFPVMAIGGINAHNIESIMEKGACGAAVIGAIHNEVNVAKATMDLLSKMNIEPARRISCFMK